MACRFTDDEDQALSLSIAKNKERLDGTWDDPRERGLVWDAICSDFYETTRSTEKSRRQIRERFRAMKQSEVGKMKLKAGRDAFDAAQALLDLAAGSRVQ